MRFRSKTWFIHPHYSSQISKSILHDRRIHTLIIRSSSVTFKGIKHSKKRLVTNHFRKNLRLVRPLSLLLQLERRINVYLLKLILSLKAKHDQHNHQIQNKKSSRWKAILLIFEYILQFLKPLIDSHSRVPIISKNGSMY